MDYETFEFYDCKLCETTGIFPHCLIKHHKKWHSNIPYQKDHYKFDGKKLKQYQCHVCCEIVTRSQREEHQLKNHTEFKHFNHVFKQIWMVEDPEYGMMPNNQKNEDQSHVRCKHCKKKVEQNGYIQHFKQKHPEFLTSTGHTVKSGRIEKRNTKQAVNMVSVEGKKKEENDDTSTNDHKQNIPKAELCAMDTEWIEKEAEIVTVSTEAVNELNLAMVKEEKGEPKSDESASNNNQLSIAPIESQVMDIDWIKTEQESDMESIEEFNELVKEEENNEPMDNADQSVAQDTTKYYYRCINCHSAIAGRNLMKHHTNKHPNIPFHSDHYTFARMVQMKFQCNICSVIVDKPQKEYHRQQLHTQFKFINDLFVKISYNHNVSNGIIKWARKKNAGKIKCSRCKNKVLRNQFMEHFERNHPEMLNL